MRDIEFRMYDKANKKYFYGIDALERLPEWGQDPSAFGVVFEQYTGLKDKNGKKIFEGDIIRTTDNSFNILKEEMRGVVEWSRIGFIGLRDGMAQDINLLSRDLEIIGNKHDNPEFLR